MGERKRSLFRARVQKLRRIVIPKQVCDALEVDIGDIVEVEIRKADKK